MAKAGNYTQLAGAGWRIDKRAPNPQTMRLFLGVLAWRIRNLLKKLPDSRPRIAPATMP
jgi:hypothetical protein